jgi:hypothetical protein
MGAHPPKPPLALSIGVVGHRPNRLPDASRERVVAEVSRVLDALAGEAKAAQKHYAHVFSPDTPQFSLVTALAEGADRIVAEAALTRGFALHALLPFPADAYKTSFEESESVAEFHSLLGRTKAVLTLPGQYEEQTRAYEILGTHLLSLSDILLTVWDGGPSEGKGGTTEILTFAMRLGIPIIYVDANGEAVTRVLWNGLVEFPTPVDNFIDLPSSDLATILPRIIDELIRPPASFQEGKAILAYVSERSFPFNIRFEFPLLMALLGVRSIRWTDAVPIKPSALAAKYASLAAHANGGDISNLASAYGWADAVGVRFSQIFRSAFVSNFLLAAFAVVLAATSPMFPNKPLFFSTAEIALIIIVIINTTVGRKFRWHQRWLEAREVTERLRVALSFWVLGLRPPTLFSGREPTWIGWYSRAIIRWQSLRSGVLDVQGLTNSQFVIDGLLKEQCNFHEKNRYLMHNAERRLEQVGLALFIATLCAAGFYFLFVLAKSTFEIIVASDTHEIVKHLIVAITAGLPALATAIYGIRMIGDFEGIARRSERTHIVLTRLIALIEQDPNDLSLLCARARSAADIMLGDVESWRVSVESRPLAIPG